jgi:hypothetical protein
MGKVKDTDSKTLKIVLPDFLKQVQFFEYDISCLDHIWRLCFSDKDGKWYQISIVKYKKTFWLHHTNGNTCSLEYTPDREIRKIDSFCLSSCKFGQDDLDSVWIPILNAALRFMHFASKNWIQVNKQIQKDYPLNQRYGIVPSAVVRDSFWNIWRIDEDLGKRNCKKFIRIVEEGYFNDYRKTLVSSLTANRYFEYCKIAYIAAKRKDEKIDTSIDGREMYKLFADGRHEGLLDIDGDSEKEFADWIDGNHPKRSRGGHPWEIKRGGNTTHIDLTVFRHNPINHDSFRILLRGESFSRLEETIRMFLAIHDASLPILIADHEDVRKRILGQDNIGIVPCYETLHRANQHFRREECVYDVMHIDELGRSKRRVLPFVTWEPLPIMRTRKI